MSQCLSLFDDLRFRQKLSSVDLGDLSLSLSSFDDLGDLLREQDEDLGDFDLGNFSLSSILRYY